MTTNDNRQDIYQQVTDRIIAAIEAGSAGDGWRMPWHSKGDGTPTATPLNAVSRKPYRGVNVVALWATAQAMGYDAGLWAT